MTARIVDILLVEDDPADLALTMAAIRKSGFEGSIGRARDGVEAIEFLHGRANLFRRVGGGDTERGDVEIADQEGGRRTLECVVNRGFMADRNLVILRDVTVQRALLAETRERHHLEGVIWLAGGIAHDFNNILAAIVNFAELALAEMPLDGPGRTEIDQVLHAADRAAVLVQQILTFSRQQVVQPTVVDVRDVVANFNVILRRPLGSHIALTVEATETPATVFADRAQLEQIIVNLVVNARDALPQGGRITVRIAHQEVGPGADGPPVAPGPYVRLEVTDTGTGMDAATRARVFEPFFTTKPVGRNAGLGLATAYATVQLLRGAIKVDSEIGQGSRFVVLLPAAEPSSAFAEPATERMAEAPGPESGVAPGGAAGSTAGRTPASPENVKPRTILIAEDDPAVRSILAQILGGGGFRTLLAPDGLEALDVAHGTADIDLLVTDVVMPGMNGLVLATRLLEEDRVRRVLLISGYRDLDPLGDLALDPRVAFLAKPFNVAALREAVANVLAP